MNNSTKIKKHIKACITKEDLKNIAFFAISFDNTSTDEWNRSFNITKNQYIKSDISTLVEKKDFKFPLEVKQFKNQSETLKAINADKKKAISLVKINNNLFHGKKAVFFHKTNVNEIKGNINNLMLDMIKFLKLLKHLNENKEIEIK